MHNRLAALLFSSAVLLGALGPGVPASEAAAPVAVDDVATTAKDTPASIPVLANDSDPDGDVLEIVDPPFACVMIFGFSCELPYTPPPGFCGTDVVSYTISDGQSTDAANVTVTVACPPEVETLGVDLPGTTGVTLTAEVTPRGFPTTAWFEWGADPVLASPNQTGPVDVGTGVEPVLFAFELGGLDPSVTYYYRVVAQSGEVTVRGDVEYFATEPASNQQIVVNSADDAEAAEPGKMTIREAIARLEDGGVITFDPRLDGARIELTVVGEPNTYLKGEVFTMSAGKWQFLGYQDRNYGKSALHAAKSLSIDASGLPSGITLAWAGGEQSPARVLSVYGNLTMNKVTVTGGYAAADPLPDDPAQPHTLARGGGIAVWGTATLVDCVLGGNRVVGDASASRDRGAFGGAIYADTVELSGCVVSGNSATGYGAAGGGIFSVGGVETFADSRLQRTAITGNKVTAQHAYGGGVYSDGGGPGNLVRMTIDTCTIARNLVEDNPALAESAMTQYYYRGGGFYMSNGLLELIGSTVAENAVTGVAATFSGKPNMGGGGIGATVGDAHVVESMDVRQSIIVGNTLAGAPGDLFTGSLIDFYSSGYNVIGEIDFSPMLVPVPSWLCLSRRHYPKAGDVDGVAPAEALDLSNAELHPTIVSVGTDAGANALLWYPPGRAAVNRIPAGDYTVPVVWAEYHAIDDVNPVDDFPSLVLGKLRTYQDGLLGPDFGSGFGDLSAVVWYEVAYTWPSDPLNAPWIQFWKDVDAEIGDRLGTVGLGDEFWGTFESGPFGENVEMYVWAFESGPFARGEFDQLGFARVAGDFGDIGAVETGTEENLPPTLDAIGDVAVLEDAGLQTIGISGITAGAGESQELAVSATSSNPALIPDPAVSYASPDATGSLSFTPAANASGSATITVTVDDGKAYDNTVSRTFTVTVTAVNDPPTLDAIADVTIDEDAALQTVEISGISAGPGESQGLTVTATSSNTGLIPDPAVSYVSPDATGSLGFTPAANASGSATITVTADDGESAGATTSRSFTVTVNAVNDPPTTANASGVTAAGADRAFSAADFPFEDIDAGDTLQRVQAVSAPTAGTLYVDANGNGLVEPGETLAAGGEATAADCAAGRFKFKPGSAASGSTTFTFKVSDGQAYSAVATMTLNGAPTGITLSANLLVGGKPAGTAVGTLATTDPDGESSFDYELASGAGDTDNGSFQIVGNVLQTAVALDYTGRSSFSVRVRSTDLGGLWTEEAFTVVPPAYVLWTRSDTGRAVLWTTDPGDGSGSPKLIPVADVASVHSTSGNGSRWQATSYAHVSATEGYVLWTREDTGRAVLWRVDPSAAGGSPKLIPITDVANVQSASGIGAPWQATSYAHVSATEGYVLWTRADTGRAVLWRIDPSAAGGSPKVIPVGELASLQSTSGIGASWQATSYAHVGATEGYVLWTRADTGRAVLWKIDPSAGGGSPKVIPVGELASLQSTSGIGGPWQATSYAHVSATEGYVLWTRADTGRAVLWRIDPGSASGAPRIIPIGNLASVQSTGGVGGPWQATSYSHAAASFTLTIRSGNPDSGASITVTPPDGSGQADGTSPFLRNYRPGTVVTLTAPEGAGGNLFHSWAGCDSGSDTTCTVVMDVARTVTVSYAAGIGACEDCHASNAHPGSDGVAGTADDAPNVMGDGTLLGGDMMHSTPQPYDDGSYGYNVNGHGRDNDTSVESHGDPIGVACTACHDIGVPAGTHLDGVLNGRLSPDTRNANSFHLVAGFINAAPAQEWSVQVTFDDYCFNACHVGKTSDMRHAVDTGGIHATPNVAEFGQYGYPAPVNNAPPDMFYDANLTWLGAFNGEPNYAPCVSCHNPHGTNVSSSRTDRNNKMMIYSWMRPATLCSKCHQ